MCGIDQTYIFEELYLDGWSWDVAYEIALEVIQPSPY
jgi:hypothetical protein